MQIPPWMIKGEGYANSPLDDQGEGCANSPLDDQGRGLCNGLDLAGYNLRHAY